MRRLLWTTTCGAAAGLVVLAFNPLHGRVFNLAWLACLLLVVAGSLRLGWQHRWLRRTVLLMLALSLLPLVLPERKADRQELRAKYVERLRAYNGTVYFWGGESGRGIDCSGLPRRAWREALFLTGLRHLDGGSLREGVKHWWNDASARALSEGYLGYTTALNIEGKIPELPSDELLPGDLAITTCGTHLIVYLGEDHWIQADPGLGKVAILHGRQDRNSWFQIPVTLHRWSLLMAASKT